MAIGTTPLFAVTLARRISPTNGEAQSEPSTYFVEAVSRGKALVVLEDHGILSGDFQATVTELKSQFGLFTSGEVVG